MLKPKVFYKMKIENLLVFYLSKVNKNGYVNTYCSFDIETTSTYFNNEKVAITYLMMLNLNNFKIVFRTWSNFVNFIDRLKNFLDGLKLIIYVHNLSFEFQFMRKYFKWDKVFAIESRKVVQCITDNIEFRCSYLLTCKSLDKLGKECHKYPIKKLVGELDYKLVRTPITPVLAREMSYLCNDTQIIINYLKEYENPIINKIPLTKTGKVRNIVRNNCLHSVDKNSNRNYRELINSLTIEEKEYYLLKLAFQGGFTHSNPIMTNKVIENVYGVDETSAYPSVMTTEVFPMSKGVEYAFNNIEDYERKIIKYHIIGCFTFINIYTKEFYDFYITSSKCIKIDNPIISNGRVVSADCVTICLTELDYQIIKNNYYYDNVTISTAYIYKKGYLPKQFINSVLQFYNDKTKFKGVKGFELDYVLSKENVNSLYGMCATDICKDNQIYDNDTWKEEKCNIKETLNKYNSSKKRFISYVWGVYVTAYARYNLWMGINELKYDYIYSDTDSLKYINHDKHNKFFDNYEKMLKNKQKKIIDLYNFNINIFAPKDIKGNTHLLGNWDIEYNNIIFKTLGAKRYIIFDGDYHLTCAGVSKKSIEYIKKYNVFEKFDNNLYIPKEYTCKLTHTYIDDEFEGEIVDYLNNKCYVKELSGVHLEEQDYNLEQSAQFINFMKGVQDKYE